MNERLVTFGSALAALLLVGGLLSGGGRSAPPPRSKAGSQDAGPTGHQGAWRWLTDSGVRVARLQERYTGLDAAGGAPTGNLLVLTMRVVHRSRTLERDALRAWVERGNDVLLLTPESEILDLRDGVVEDHDVFDALGFTWQWRSGDADRDERTPSPGPAFPACATAEVKHGTISGPLRRLRPFAPNAAHPVLQGVHEVAIKSAAFEKSGWIVPDGDDRLWRPLLCDPEREAPAFSLFRLGSGHVWAFGYTRPFANDNLGRADNARLLANLVAFSLGPRGTVIFDDMHQGDSVLYDPQAFFGDPRLYRTILFLLGLWMVWLLADTGHFAAPAPRRAVVAARDFVRAQGRFLARHLRDGEGASALLRRFHDRVRRRHGLPGDGTPSWEWLQRDPRTDAARVAELRRIADDVARGRRVDVARLHNLTLELERID